MLHKETVEPATLGLLNELMTLTELEQFRLVGGTALSLLLGHRQSIDLDLFTDEPFDRDGIIEKLQITYPVFQFTEKKSARLFFTKINNIKIDFVHTFEPFNYGCYIEEGIRFGSVPDIIALKLNAVAGRGAKKDFWDLHELLNHYSFQQMMSFYSDHYPQNSPMMVHKSINYFKEAEKDPNPFSYRDLSWPGIKKDIIKKFNLYLGEIN